MEAVVVEPCGVARHNDVVRLFCYVVVVFTWIIGNRRLRVSWWWRTPRYFHLRQRDLHTRHKTLTSLVNSTHNGYNSHFPHSQDQLAVPKTLREIYWECSRQRAAFFTDQMHLLAPNQQHRTPKATVCTNFIQLYPSFKLQQFNHYMC